MTVTDIAQIRLSHQLIAQPLLNRPEDVVTWLGAVQAQDYPAAKWAVGLRTQSLSDDDIEQAFASGAILRTHIMRPTWHFVTPDDIRWLLTLTSPHVHAANAYWYRKMELDDETFTRSNAILARALQNEQQLTRSECAALLQQAGIATDDSGRLNLLIMHAELDGVICSGQRRGKQHTYALLDARAPQGKNVDRSEALAELTRRYFTSHGPATLQDFVWWSGLSTTDARNGLAMISSHLSSMAIGNTNYWFAAKLLSSSGDLRANTSPELPIPPTGDHPHAKKASLGQDYQQPVSVAAEQTPPQPVHLLPNYDEYTVGYTDRSTIFNISHTEKLDSRGNILFNNVMVLDGQVIGTWTRIQNKSTVLLKARPFIPLSQDVVHAFAREATRYGSFLSASLKTIFQIEEPSLPKAASEAGPIQSTPVQKTAARAETEPGLLVTDCESDNTAKEN